VLAALQFALVAFSDFTPGILADPPLATPAPPLQPVAWWAVPSNNPHYIGYYAGGGAPLRRSEPRGPDDGTWGWDYRGWLISRRVTLGWWHGRRYQGGTGAYRTDGPHYHEPP
jgi:hypothetical protein